MFSLGPEFQPFPASAMSSTAQSGTGTTQAGICWGGSLLWLSCWLPAGEMKGQRSTRLRTEGGQAAWGIFVFVGALGPDRDRKSVV